MSNTPVLYEPDVDEPFELTPDYNQLLVEWEIANPEHPDPRFGADECAAFTFHWPGNAAPKKPATALERRRAQARKSNGQPAITARKD